MNPLFRLETNWTTKNNLFIINILVNDHIIFHERLLLSFLIKQNILCRPKSIQPGPGCLCCAAASTRREEKCKTQPLFFLMIIFFFELFLRCIVPATIKYKHPPTPGRGGGGGGGGVMSNEWGPALLTGTDGSYKRRPFTLKEVSGVAAGCRDV